MPLTLYGAPRTRVSMPRWYLEEKGLFFWQNGLPSGFFWGLHCNAKLNQKPRVGANKGSLRASLTMKNIDLRFARLSSSEFRSTQLT